MNPAKRPELTLKKIGQDHVKFFVAKNKTNIPKRLFCDLSLSQAEDILKKSKSHWDGWTIVQSSNLEVIRTLACAGQGIAILPERVAFAESRMLVPYKEKELPCFHDSIYLAYRKEVFEHPAAKQVLESARIVLSS